MASRDPFDLHGEGVDRPVNAEPHDEHHESGAVQDEDHPSQPRDVGVDDERHSSQPNENGNDREIEQNDDNEHDEETHSASPTEKYNQRVARASTVWLTGLFCGRSYVPRPKKIDEAELSESAKEELLMETTYTVPRGYKYYKEDLPSIISPKPEGSLSSALVIHLILNFVAFVFTLAASCPVAWYRGRDVVVGVETYKGRKFTLWKQQGGSLPTFSVHSMKNCPIEKQFFQTIAASTIMGCFFTVVSLIFAGVRFFGRGGYGWILLFSFLAFGWTLCGNAMSISLYYLSRCESPRFSNVAHLNAGFALTLIAWIFQLAGLLAVVFTTRLNVGPVLRSLRVMDTYYMVLLLVALAFVVIANATTVWKRKFNTGDVKVVRITYWHTELVAQNGTSLYYGRAHYRCGAYGKRMKASISFLILGSIMLFMALMFAIPAFLARGCRIASMVFTCLAAIFLIISWVIAVVVRYRKSCTLPVPKSTFANYPGVPTGVFHGKTDFPGYGVQEGVILSIIAWILTVAAFVLNIVVPWPEIKN
ncbi:hypothetical protein ABB37_01715 [Leptomonas pyrrhocoris]|uniref:Amastin surface glycoprotein n=1 Tax=Leptomonas pyrrhocoris TaxID=157538 RepID=A0A0N0DZK9_LEPPY|nr:hypothetical protein ABB37_01715 [Leptomonas pyrrhocoris]XP_015663845.1 hypothetical protein ABB37_01715 [Leptomonas pyrrhocoris]KPA85405.1 hypothetical protein ABB37_01715 [Leptomonas pyrrhocoris]KPA85406.1 hypothetical protein ABB37_01715 [Leptomonas pyrrhocoris]|eukprot:XP_015663844.1 hypothetical protein ABB37_01715 [Leptomonas pyrrhocoris]